ncbi:ATP-binding protein [Dinghuibacter silviterrae]|uniref:ATP-dependent DNA helicase RecG n=1 Tax=Dinghuibacter silviterrae TaxID=1539049 RepID=A0A4R8DPB0_9BACT|nr:ATP-binding protein [Dinghuibacter silviterrae]TDW99911.1 ATP-dependent DNA helicase RecG [Dinghuibacter silviterrae]
MAGVKESVGYTARDYMLMAIEEMRRSVNEARIDGKVPPKVGAVILFPDGEVTSAHRGELREGDHAEYTLIERKLSDKNLSECTLFTTLEPCVERGHPKIACCRRTTNARIKTVYIGIIDPDPTVSTKGINHLEKNGVRVVMFDRDLQKEIEKENVDFLKQALERKRKVEEEPLPTIDLPIATSNIDTLSVYALQKFIDQANLSFKVEQPEFKTFLTDLGVLAIDKKDGQQRPTGFGILLFGRNPRTKYKQAVLKCSVDYGESNIESKDFDQPLVLVPELVEEWIRKVLPITKDTSTFRRRDVPVFPMEVLREAVINAIVHRDYSIDGAKSYLQINSDKIVIKSPGSPVHSISLEQLNTFKAPSISRNPVITYVFNLMKYVEEAGFGMEALQSLQLRYGLPLPEYTFQDPFLTLTFPRSMEAVKRVSVQKGVDMLSEDELQGYEFIKLKEKVTRQDYEHHFKFDKKKAERHLSKFVSHNLIERKGAGPTTYYQVIATLIAT